MGGKRSGSPWALAVAAASSVLFGCAAAKTRPASVYVSVDRLLDRHPAMADLALSPGQPGGSAPPRTEWRASVRGPTKPVSPGSRIRLPAPLRPKEVGRDRAAVSDASLDPSGAERLVALERSMRSRAGAAKARDVRLMRAAIAAELAHATREVEDRIAAEQSELTRRAHPRLRDLDLRILALTAQRGSLAAGPPEDVERALREAKAEKRQYEARLKADMAAIRMRHYAAVRERMEQREADLERGVGIADAERAREVEIALRRHRAALSEARRSLPRDDQDAVSSPAKPGVHRVTRQIGDDRLWDAGTWSLEPARALEPRTSSDELLREVRDRARRDIVLHVERVCATRGWSPVFSPRPGTPDRTGEIATALAEDGLLR